MDPEDWAEIMNGAFEHLIAPVYRYEGTLARLMGDAILAFFGAPIAHEDDPERAVLAGLGIVEGIEPYKEQVRDRWDLDFNVRVGINTGLVVVGEVGSDLRMEYTAMGDAVNLASRMEQMAQPGTVQISEETYKRIAPLFELEPLGEIEVKGKQAPVPAYQVVGRKTEPGRLRGIQGLEAPLVGRGPEMDVLRKALDDLASGHGSIHCLIGEAGLGKSRMMEELRQDFQNQGYWAESRGVSYETTRPYGQFQQHIENLYGITESDQSEEILEKLGMGASDLELSSSGIQALQALLAVDKSSDGEVLEGEALKDELFEANLTIWRQQADDLPTVLVFDDLHWADPASTELLSHLFRLTDAAPIMFLCAFRPDRSAPSWRVKQTAETEFPHRYKEILLQPLDAGNSRELVDHLLTISELPPKLHTMIQEKSEGNPFFVEEVVRSLIDSGAVEQSESGARWTAGTDIDEIQIPDNLQSLLVSRIDRLEGEARHTLQLASVIGRSFYYRVLQSISQAVEELDSHLSVLQRVELILEAARDPEREYAFRHALTQEAAYRSILRKERSAFHLQVGEALEQLFPERKAELAPLLAHHFLQADDDRGSDYSITAGDEAFRMYAIEAAIRHYQNALETTDAETLKHVYTRLGRSLELIDEFDEALDVYNSMVARGQELGYGELELIALTESAKIYSIPNALYSLERTRELSDEALEVARRLENHEAEARILWTRSNSEKFAGDMELAVEYGDQSLALAERYDLGEQLAFTLNDLAGSLTVLGETDRSREVLSRSHRMWLQMDNKPMLADNLQTQAALSYWLGEYKQAIDLAQESYQITQALENMWGQVSALMRLGQIRGEMGHFEQAVQAHEKCLQVAREIGMHLPVMAMGTSLALLYGNLGAMKRAWKMMEQVQSLDRGQFRAFWPVVWAVSSRLHLWEGDLPAARQASDRSYKDYKSVGVINIADYVLIADAEAALAEERPDHALELMDELLGLAELAGRRIGVPDTLLVRALSLRALGKIEDARESLRQARLEAEEIGSGRTLWRILLEQSRLEAVEGSAALAAEFGAEARNAVSDILEQLEDPELRESFEALPEVQEALAS
jgi:predicted ATPase/class 3 adenylate cyclase